MQLGLPPLPLLPLLPPAVVSPPDDEPPGVLPGPPPAPVPTRSLEQAETASTPRAVKPAHLVPVQAMGAVVNHKLAAIARDWRTALREACSGRTTSRVLDSDGMLAQRLTVISAFAGGCLCTALLGFWKSDTTKPAAVSERRASLFVAPLAAEPDAAAEVRAEPPEPSAVADDGTGEESGTSVAEVLSRLETAYRIVSAAKAIETEKAIEAPSPAEPEPEPRAEIVVPAPVATPEPSAEPAPPASVAAAPVELPPASSAPVSAPAPASYVGEVNNNIHVGDVHVGDRYDVQQLAMIQYLQLLALSSILGGRAPVEHRFQSPAKPRAPITAIPNPDNPWGFHFPPPALVK